MAPTDHSLETIVLNIRDDTGSGFHTPSSDELYPIPYSKATVPRFSIRYARINLSSSKVGRRRAYCCRFLLVVFILAFLATIAALIWLSLVLALIHRLKPSTPSNQIQTIASHWRGPADSTNLLRSLPADFSRDILPIPVHSHNDYDRRVPLFDALAAGCTGVEADIWLPDLPNSTVLRVGHKHSVLDPSRTLSSLYIEPLLLLLASQNPNPESHVHPTAGVFSSSPDTTITLLLDFKSNGTALWPLVNEALTPFRRAGYLRSYNRTSGTVTPGPLTIVATGNAPFHLILSQNDGEYRDVFFDAPLDKLPTVPDKTPLYNATNSYYASSKLSNALGTVWLGRLSKPQRVLAREQIKAAQAVGLEARYWGTPGWPVNVRIDMWKTLEDLSVGMLNVDNLEVAARWNWNWCVVAGLTLC